METPRQAFREYDIRGVAERDLNDELVCALGRALASQLSGESSSPRLRFAVARDCRLSSDRLFKALCTGLQEQGADVIDIGVGPTPLLYFAAHHLETDGAVMITGSHNPAEDNGFKMMRGKGPLFGPEIQELRERIEQEHFSQADPGDLTTLDVKDAYIDAVRAATNLPDGSGDLRIVVDAGNGSAGPLGIETLEALGIEVDPLFCDMDGRFPNHHPDPTVEDNLLALRERVLQTGASLGIAWDGDGDRIGALDECGEVIWGDKLMILFSRAVLAEHPQSAILGEVKCSETLFSEIRKHNGRAIICRTGHSLIKKRMKEENALLAGEMSGHIFFADRYFGYDDAIYAAARLIELIVQQARSPRQLLADVPQTAVTPEIRMPCADDIKFAVIDKVLEHFRPRYDVLDIDGARINFGEGAWGLCRASNTGPILVLRFEASDETRRDAIRAEVESVVEQVMQELSAA